MFKHGKLFALCAVVLMVTVLLSTGCSNSNSNSKLKNYGRIRLTYENLPEDVASMYISLYNGAGACLSTKSVDLADYPTSVMVYGVNIRCKSLAIACYDEAAESVKYFDSQEVTVKANETTDVKDMTFTAADKVTFRSYGFDIDTLRAHTGDTIAFSNIVSVGTDADHYWMDLSDYSTWTVGTKDRLSSTSASDKTLAKGHYRCLSTVDDNVPVVAKFGKYEANGCVDITDATVSDTGLFATYQEALAFTPEISSTLKVPDGADYRYLYHVAKWSDGIISLCNTSSEWGWKRIDAEGNSIDDNGEMASNHGRIKSYIVSDDESDDVVFSIQATYTSNDKSYEDTCSVQVTDADLTGIKVNPTTKTVTKGDEFVVVPLGVYGTDTEVELDGEAFTVSSDDPACVEPNASIWYCFSAKDVGTAVLTFVEKTKKYEAKCTVTVE